MQQISVADLNVSRIDPVGTPSIVLKQYYIDDAARGIDYLLLGPQHHQHCFKSTTQQRGSWDLCFRADKFTPIRAILPIINSPTSSFDVNAGYAVGYRVERTTNGFSLYLHRQHSRRGSMELDQSHVYRFRKTLNQANIYAAGYFDITECPVVAGYAWVCQNAQTQLSGSTTPYDGGSKVNIITDTAGTAQFSDVDTSLWQVQIVLAD